MLKLSLLKCYVLPCFLLLKLSLIDFQELPREPFIPLTKEEEAEVERAFSANWYD